ncbi:hypothetical protein ADK55_24640 [Streptomyces sp. WM4235]|nr:hypothetical protein ADK55_24640 [Streptomyces sp. WM4235]
MQGGVLRFGAGAAGAGPVGDFAPCPAARPARLGAHRPAQPARAVGRLRGGSALQQPDPDGLFQVGRVHSGGRGLRGRLGGEQRSQFVQEVGVLQQVHAGRDAGVPPGGFRAGPGTLVRETPRAR